MTVPRSELLFNFQPTSYATTFKMAKELMKTAGFVLVELQHECEGFAVLVTISGQNTSIYRCSPGRQYGLVFSGFMVRPTPFAIDE